MEIYTVCMVLAVPITLWLIFMFVLPAAARSRFLAVVSEIRDIADDAVLDGSLPDADPVREFITKCDALMAGAKTLSFSLLLAIHAERLHAGENLKQRGATYGALSPAERKLMHNLDETLASTVAWYIIHGSKLYVPMSVAMFALRRSASLSKAVATPRPAQLANEFTRGQRWKQDLAHA